MRTQTPRDTTVKRAILSEIAPTKREVAHLLAAFAQAIMLGDARAVATLWEVPALVISDGGTRSLSTTGEVGMYLEGVARRLDERGVSGVRPEIQRMSWSTDRLVTVLVRWPYLSADGCDVGKAETSSYVLRRSDGDHLRVVAVIEMGLEPEIV